jgi:hypothetical protein
MGEEGTIRRLVKEIDPRFDCRFDLEQAEYIITQKSPLGQVSFWAAIPWNGITKDFFDHMRQTLYVNRNGDPMREMEEHNRKIVERREQAQDDAMDDLARETGPAMRRAFLEM